MADVWEKDLAQKSSLTTSDFIRVVGSDNVSYKQSVDNVMSTMGITTYTLTSSESLIDVAADDTKCRTNRATIVNPRNGNTPNIPTVYGLAYVNKRVSGTYSIYLFGEDKNVYVYNNASATWTKMPTRAEVDALANKHNTIPVSGKTFSFNTSGQTNASWLVIGCSGTVAPFCFLVSTASGNVVINELVDPYGLTWTGALSGTTLTITCSASLTSNVKVIGL